jgi:hypothetical protein
MGACHRIFLIPISHAGAYILMTLCLTAWLIARDNGGVLMF